MFNNPNYTQIPNDLFDDYMKDMTGADFKIISAICRKTFGWQKTKDKISISQLKKMTNVGRRQIIESLKKLEEMTHIKLTKKNGTITEIEIMTSIHNDTSAEKELVKLEPVQKRNRGSAEKDTGTGAEKEHTKESIKETITKESSAHKKICELFNDKYKSETGDGITNWKKEGNHVKSILEKTKNSIEPVSEKMKIFEKLRRGTNKFWHDKPYLPSVLNSLWDWIVIKKLSDDDFPYKPVWEVFPEEYDENHKKRI